MSCYLRLLGEAVLETPTGGKGLGTGKGSMLLVYLAYRGERVRREALMALLWPEASEERARASLRQLLHMLRRTPYIGGLSITEKWVHWSVETDVAAFYSALQGGDRRAALARYRGPLLAEFESGDSDVFDDWLEGERQTLFLAYRSAVFAFSSELRHDPAAAAETLAQLLHFDPFDEDALAERLELLALAGQTRQALAEYESYQKRLEHELGETPAGTLSDLVAGLRAQAPKADSPSRQDPEVVAPEPVPSGLPFDRAPPSAFVGRAEERASLLRCLSDPACRLLTLVGPGGMGKTRLALEFMTEAAATFRDGALFVGLEAVPDAKGLAPALVARLGLLLEAHTPPETQVAAHLAATERLLILDNFEGLLDAKDFVAQLLGRAPGLKVLVTTRERLNLFQEETFELRGLSLPQSAADTNPETSDAVLLFLQGARRAGARVTPQESARRAVFDICTHVGGMPLALELTSAWLGLLSLEEVSAELTAGLDLLVEPGSALPERHRSMRLVLERSWERLGEPEAQALARLSVFRSGLAYGAAKAVTGMSVGVLLGLVNKSFVYRETSGRLTLHELVRQYAHEQLQASGALAEAQDAHARYYLDLLGRLEMWSDKEPASLATLDTELENVRAAWRWAAASGQLPALLPPNDVVVFFDRRMRFLEGLELLQTASVLYDPAHPGEREMLASLSTDRAWLLFRLARYDEAETFALRTLELSEAPKTRMKAFNTLGIITRQQGRYEEAVAHIEGALRLAQELGETARVAAYLHNLGATYMFLTRYDRAEEASRAALSLYQADDDFYGIVTSLIDLGVIYLAQQAYEPVLSIVDEALVLAREHNFHDVFVVLLLVRAQALERFGSVEEAKIIGHELLSLTNEPGHSSNRVMTLNLLGRIAVLQHEPTQARRYLMQGFLLAWRHKDTPNVLENMVARAELELCEHHPKRAYKLLSVAVRTLATPPFARQNAEKLLRVLEHTLQEFEEPSAGPLERWLPAFLGLEARLD